MEPQNEVQGTPEEVYDFLIKSEELLDLPYPQSVGYLGILIDLSLDLGRVKGLEYAQRWAEGLSTRELTSQQCALLHYFRSSKRELRDRFFTYAQHWKKLISESYQQIADVRYLPIWLIYMMK
jgi:hypothetical protein